MTEFSPEVPILNIVGERVALGPFSKDVLPLFTRWINALDAQLRVGFQNPGPVTAEFEEGWYDSVSTGSERNTFVIRERETMTAVGSTALHGVDLRHLTATFGIMISGPEGIHAGGLSGVRKAA